jgi:hypothetical protein
MNTNSLPPLAVPSFHPSGISPEKLFRFASDLDLNNPISTAISSHFVVRGRDLISSVSRKKSEELTEPMIKHLATSFVKVRVLTLVFCLRGDISRGAENRTPVFGLKIRGHYH